MELLIESQCWRWCCKLVSFVPFNVLFFLVTILQVFRDVSNPISTVKQQFLRRVCMHFMRNIETKSAWGDYPNPIKPDLFPKLIKNFRNKVA